MNNLLRNAIFLPEFSLFGPSYSVVKYLARSPQPLEPEWTWNYITRRLPRLQDWIRLNLPPHFVRLLLLRSFLRSTHERGIASHYDVSNDFYRLFLDQKYMLYSCADFVSGQETLEEAQSNKVRFIMGLVDPRPGEKILELGCGWGGLLQEVYERTGERHNIFGYTISQQQVEYNEKHRGFNVQFKNFITGDHPPDMFDKIYSVGAWEHVRPSDLHPTLKKLFGTLKPGGKMVTHFFCRPESKVGVAALVGQIFFPGSVTPPYPVQIRTAQEVGFRVDHQSLHDTYRETLRQWFERLVENRDAAIDLVGIETYNRYLLFFACSWKFFDDVGAILLRIVLRKPSIGEGLVT